MAEFSIHPTELRRRRRRCNGMVTSWQVETEAATHCDACGWPEKAVIGCRDRYGFQVRTAMCLACGAFFLLDRLSSKDVREFYEGGFYRSLIGCWKRVPQTKYRLETAQLNYAKLLCRFLAGLLKPLPSGKFLDIGGSTGDVAREVVDQFGWRGTVLDPAKDEVAAARSKGLDGIVGTLETWDNTDKFDLVLLCRTLEHLPDLSNTLNRIRAALKPSGLFYCDIADFMSEILDYGAVEAVTKIDHCVWLTQESAISTFSRHGFRIAAMNLTLPPNQIGFLLRRADDQEPNFDSSSFQAQQNLKLIRATLIQWQRFGRKPVDAADWFRRMGFRLKNSLVTIRRD